MNMEMSRIENLSIPDSPWQESEWGHFKQLNLLPNPSVSNQNCMENIPESSSTFKVKRRDRGDGSGYIQCHYANRHLKSQIKSYKQYWYHYELWSNGERLVKGSVYIPKAKLGMIQKMESLKLSVLVILETLGKKI
jgi:hypothetical protein